MRFPFVLLFVFSFLLFFSCSKFEEKIEVLFCPKDDCYYKFVNLIKNAKRGHCVLYSLDKEIELLLKEKNFELIENFGKQKLLHSKWCVFDNLVFVGSWNPKQSDKADAVILINSSKIAKYFLSAFKNLKLKRKFFAKEKEFKIKNSKIKIKFCPKFCRSEIVEELMKANKSIIFATFIFTDSAITRLLHHKAKKLEVRGLIAAKNFNKTNFLIKNLSKAVKNLHHKFFIIDEKIVITGSYNPTLAAAFKNQETIVFIEDKRIAKKFLNAFKALEENAETRAATGINLSS